MKAILNKAVTGYTFILVVLLIFYVIPQYVDIIVGVELNSFLLVSEAMNDEQTQIIYNSFISVVLFFFSYVPRFKLEKQQSYLAIARALNTKLIGYYKKYSIALWLIIVFPIFYVLLFGDLDFYSTYLTRSLEYSGQIPESHNLINKLSLVSALIAAFVLNALIYQRRTEGKSTLHLMLVLAFIIFILFWIDGKRGIVAKFLLAFLSLLFVSKTVATKTLITTIGTVFLLFISFIAFYGKNVEGSFKDSYQALRVDFSRDYGVKFAIYNDIVLNRHILPEPLASFKFATFAYVPRTLWPDKPYPYAVYFTNSIFGDFGGERLYGWGLTTSIFAESISNLYVLGLLFGPWLIYVIIRKETRSSNPIFKLLSIVIAVLLLVTQVASFMPLVLIYLFMRVWKGSV